MSNGRYRLTIGDYVAKNYNTIVNKDYELVKNSKYKTIYKGGQNFIANYLYIKSPKLKRTNKVTLINLIPMQNGYSFKVSFNYQYTDTSTTYIEPTKTKDMVSVDLGMKNLMTIYDPIGEQKIIKGGLVISINEHYNKLIGDAQSTTKKINKLSNSNRIKRLHIQRTNRINNIFHNITNRLYELYNDKKKIIFGYNENWKQNIKLGKNTDRKFCSIPFRRLMTMIREKFGEERVVEVQESYTSKCDALAFEQIKKHSHYKGKRSKRGLFSSSTDKLINADLNGAINIMRNYCRMNDVKMTKIKGTRLCNPVVVKTYSP